ncbi:MAG: fumarylacetoacetate hydrolase family protein [Kiritimatiellales bacterium]
MKLGQIYDKTGQIVLVLQNESAKLLCCSGDSLLMNLPAIKFIDGKSFDTFALPNQFLMSVNEVGDPNNLSVRMILDGDVVPEASTKIMIHTVPKRGGFLFQRSTLLAGTIVLMRTSKSVDRLRSLRNFLHSANMVISEKEGNVYVGS